MRNFLSREQALEARARLDATHAERMHSSTAPRWNRPAREDGSEFNQTEVLRLHSRYEPGLRSQLWHGAQRANSAGSWGYSIAPLPRNVEALQSVRYEAPHGWYAEHVDTRFTWNRLNHTYSERVVAAIVQLSDRHSRGDYTGGELQLVLQSGAVLDAPGCAGDAVFFPAAYLRHRVQHLRSGTRRNLVWWAKGRARRN